MKRLQETPPVVVPAVAERGEQFSLGGAKRVIVAVPRLCRCGGVPQYQGVSPGADMPLGF